MKMELLKYWSLAMSSKKLLRTFIRGILLICIALVLLHVILFYDWYPLSKILSFRPSEETLKNNLKKVSGLQVFEPAQFDNQSDVKCINVTFGNLSFPMCVYDPQNDIYVSKNILAGNYFEGDLVQKILSLCYINPDLSFVDLGANIGTYSLPIAHSGIHVVSVEPSKDTVRRLAKSVHLGRIENNVDIFRYALSNKVSTTFLKFDADNRGHTFIASNGSCAGCMSANVTVLNKLIPFIRHKQVFIKIDTEEAEINIFQTKCAAKFFSKIDVLMIQMEWRFYRVNYGNTEVGKQRADHFLEFFYQRDYDVYDPRREQKLNASWTKWPDDVLFKKKHFPQHYLFAI